MADCTQLVDLWSSTAAVKAWPTSVHRRTHVSGVTILCSLQASMAVGSSSWTCGPASPPRRRGCRPQLLAATQRSALAAAVRSQRCQHRGPQSGIAAPTTGHTRRSARSQSVTPRLAASAAARPEELRWGSVLLHDTRDHRQSSSLDVEFRNWWVAQRRAAAARLEALRCGYRPRKACASDQSVCLVCHALEAGGVGVEHGRQADRAHKLL